MNDEYVNIYEPVDPVLFRWARRRLLRWDTSYRDEQCRHLFLGRMEGPRVQMSAAPPADGRGARVFVSFWPDDGRGRWESREYEGTLEELPARLDEALAQARTWLGKHPLTWGQRLGRHLQRFAGRPIVGGTSRPI